MKVTPTEAPDLMLAIQGYVVLYAISRILVVPIIPRIWAKGDSVEMWAAIIFCPFLIEYALVESVLEWWKFRRNERS